MSLTFVSKILFTFLFIVISSTLYSQDVHFSQRMASVVKKNPAFMGNYEGNWRLILDHRRQWQSIGVPYLTSAMMYSHKFYPSFTGKRIVGGLNYINDKSGDAKLSINHIELAAAYEHDYFNNTFILGFQAAYYNKQFSDAQLTFPGQYDRNIGDFNKDLPSGENFSGNELSFINFNIGAAWKRKLNDRWTSYSGFSLHNINQAEESFLDGDNQHAFGYGIQLMAYYNWKVNTVLQPSLDYYRTSAASELIMGANLRQKFKQGKFDAVFGGIHARNGFGRNNDAIIVNAGLSYLNVDVGVSYDFNVSDLQIASSYKGGFEFMVVITDNLSILKQKSIPCERF